jgi:hypothetical protein
MIEEKIQDKLRAVEEDNFSELEIAIRLEKSPRTLERWFKQGVGPPATLVQNGRRQTRRYNKKKFLQWLVDREQKPAMRARGARS